jgi:glutathione S-transferase
MPQDDSTNRPHHANPGYAAVQIARALTTSEQHGDAATRERARVKAEKWMGVLERLLSGHFAVGSRQPMADAPVWATPEVFTGGFVTGTLLAGGPMRPHEMEIAARIGADAAQEDRQKLNTWFLSDAGFVELAERLNSGCYEIEVPEEAEGYRNAISRIAEG